MWGGWGNRQRRVKWLTEGHTTCRWGAGTQGSALSQWITCHLDCTTGLAGASPSHYPLAFLPCLLCWLPMLDGNKDWSKSNLNAVLAPVLVTYTSVTTSSSSPSSPLSTTVFINMPLDWVPGTKNIQSRLSKTGKHLEKKRGFFLECRGKESSSCLDSYTFILRCWNMFSFFMHRKSSKYQRWLNLLIIKHTWVFY